MIGATVNSVLNSGTHGRERRQQRHISKIELQRARRYGMREAGHRGRLKYTYGGVVFIYDPMTNREVTSFPSTDKASETSGTKCTYPIILEKRLEYENAELIQRHNLERKRIISQQEKWKSHSVLIVDMSGSMRRDDVNGAKCRSDGVWMSLARDFCQKPLENKIRTKYDLISIIVMKEEAELVLELEPTDWVLYNKLIDMREWTALRPEGHGYYMPSLDLADKLLTLNPLGSCALSLVFWSDGKPSDNRDPTKEGCDFSNRMGEIASKYGRRLSFWSIGMADEKEDFSVLNDMVTEAESYGAIASFNKPTLDSDSLSNIVTSLATSLTTSRTEMTDMITGKSKIVRTDVLREKTNAPDDRVLTDEWRVFKSTNTTNYVRRIWSWDYKRNKYVNLRDYRCLGCYKDTAAMTERYRCPGCDACYFCLACAAEGKLRSHCKSRECKKWLQERRCGNLVEKKVPSFSVAMKKPIFNEGAERIVHKFRFLNDQDDFLGVKMVAKESRFVEQEASYDQRMHYHSEFMRTQALASEFADKFNAALDGLVDHFAYSCKNWIRRMPRITFLEALVVEVVTDGGDEFNILIEPQLEGKYEKFNDNMGMVKGQSRSLKSAELDSLCDSVGHLDINKPVDRGFAGGVGGLGAIAEGSKEEEEDEGEEVTDGDIMCQKKSQPDTGDYQFHIDDRDFPQAFSHFTYEKSKKHLMVVDLQGVFNTKDDGTKEYLLTDPVIHKKDKQRGKNRHKLHKWTFGRTDRGPKGMKAFFMTHKCTDACRLLGLKPHEESSGI